MLLLLTLTLFSFLLLFYKLKRLLKSEKALAEELRIASSSFDAQEAIAITDTDSVILRVNKAFVNITGYGELEVLGKKINILKSSRHSREFYAKMWEAIQKKGHWKGEIYNKRKNGEIYPERLSISAIKNEKGITTYYIAYFWDMSELKKAEDLALSRTNFDFLTGLPNRKSMMMKLQKEHARAARHRFYSAFLFIDLDDFKKVNDHFGHAVGDTLLQEVSARLSLKLRIEDYVARISGDEFCIILVEMGQSRERVLYGLGKICQDIIDTLSAPYLINNHQITIGASIGVRIFPDKELGVNDVITHADAAMYKAKSRGKNRYFFYNEEIEEKINESKKFEKEIDRALKNEEFMFYFQPKVDIGSNKISGAELLIRWQHPIGGLIGAEVFIDVIKDIETLSIITLDALKKACHFIHMYGNNFAGTCSINLPIHLLFVQNFSENIKEIIMDYAVPASRIEFEMLENELVEDFDRASAKIRELRAFGVKFSIDDFGVGYSSLGYLKKLPIDSIKIDKKFVLEVSEAANKELIGMMIDISKMFGLLVIVEGIENEKQLQLIRQSKADQYQGYYFSKALSEEAFVEMLEKENSILKDSKTIGAVERPHDFLCER